MRRNPVSPVNSSVTEEILILSFSLVKFCKLSPAKQTQEDKSSRKLTNKTFQLWCIIGQKWTNEAKRYKEPKTQATIHSLSPPATNTICVTSAVAASNRNDKAFISSRTATCY